MAVLLFSGIAFLLIWTLHREWWRLRPVRRALWIVPVLGIINVVAWTIVSRLWPEPVEGPFLLVSFIFFLGLFAIVLGLPFSGALLTIGRAGRAIARAVRGSPRATATDTVVPATQSSDPVIGQGSSVIRPSGFDPGRRRLLTTSAAIIPAATFGTAMAGVGLSDLKAKTPHVPLLYPSLPPALDGFKILHVSDLHLGHFITLDHVEEIEEIVDQTRPDLILVTGDTVDYIPYLQSALKMFESMPAPYGVFASLGNHEYYSGIDDVHRGFDRSTIPLLVNRGTVIDVNGVSLWIGGIDDPARNDRDRDKARFLVTSLDRTLDGAPSDAFTIAMSHRPDVFDFSSDRGVDLTLAGHTHAGLQMGFNGRSLIETWFGVPGYLWGLYEKEDGRRKLYTSAGAGHWMPFRLGAPREIPLYELKREMPSTADLRFESTGGDRSRLSSEHLSHYQSSRS